MTTTTSLLAGLEAQRTTGAFRSLQQSRSLHMTTTRHNSEETAATSIPPTLEGNNDGSSGAAPDLPARKLRKLRRKEEKKKLKEAEAEAKAKAKAEKREKAKAKAAKAKAKPKKKKAAIKEAATGTEETPTEVVEAKRKERREKKRLRDQKEEDQAVKLKTEEENLVDGKEKKKTKNLKPWEEERRKKAEEKRKQEEEERRKNMEPWQIQKEALKEKFPEGWKPMKKMSPDAMAGIRALNRQFPDTYTTEVLAQKFEMSPEAIRRILRSKWEEKDETPDIDAKRQERWFNRGKAVWTRYAAMGKKPPRKWREEGITRDPKWNLPRGAARPQQRKRAGAVWALRERARPDRDEDPEAAASRRDWLSKRQHRRNLMAKERKLLRQASDNLLKSFF